MLSRVVFKCGFGCRNCDCDCDGDSDGDTDSDGNREFVRCTPVSIYATKVKIQTERFMYVLRYMHIPMHMYVHVLFIIFSLVNVIYMKISAAASPTLSLNVRVKYFAPFEIFKFNF